MEKLIELINESTKGRFKSEQDLRLCIEMRGYCRNFIKWLVDNDKIDKKKLDEIERKPIYVADDMFSLYKIDECVIMLLSISDTPIEDLISYLK